MTHRARAFTIDGSPKMNTNFISGTVKIQLRFTMGPRIGESSMLQRTVVLLEGSLSRTVTPCARDAEILCDGSGIKRTSGS